MKFIQLSGGVRCQTGTNFVNKAPTPQPICSVLYCTNTMPICFPIYTLYQYWTIFFHTLLCIKVVYKVPTTPQPICSALLYQHFANMLSMLWYTIDKCRLLHLSLVYQNWTIFIHNVLHHQSTDQPIYSQHPQNTKLQNKLPIKSNIVSNTMMLKPRKADFSKEGRKTAYM